MGKAENAGLAELFATLVQLIMVLAAFLVYCELGERISHQFNMYNQKLSNLNWYSFPIKMKRIYLIVLTGVQDPVIICGYAKTVCTRDAFKKVISHGKLTTTNKFETSFVHCLFQTVNGSFSYFMMFHRTSG